MFYAGFDLLAAQRLKPDFRRVISGVTIRFPCFHILALKMTSHFMESKTKELKNLISKASITVYSIS